MNLSALKSSILKNWKALSILVVFAVIYCLVSLVNHYNFRTNALDLGMFNHALYSFSHGKMNYFTLDLSGNNPIYFADHFSPITLLYTPFYYLFGSWTLLLIQIASLLLGAWGCYKVALLKLPAFKLNWLFLIIFLGQWAIISALAFDFHNNVVAAMLVPWLYYFYLKDQRWKMAIIFILMLSAKENIGLWLAFIMIGLMLEKGFMHFFRNWKKYIRFEIPLMLISLIYFYLVVSIIMPKLSNGEAVNQISRFGELGGSVSEIIKTLFLHPWDTFKLLFYSNVQDPISYGIKQELHKVVFFSAGFALILRPAYLLMLIPIYAQKLLGNNISLWGINYQYSIEFTPIICLALIDLVSIIHKRKLANLLVIVSAALVLIVNKKTLEHRISFWYDATPYVFYRASHYDSGGIDLPFIHKKLKEIPDEIPLSVSSCFAPHLANRDKLYHFPIIHEAKMLVLTRGLRSQYPLNNEEFDQKIYELVSSGKFKIVFDEKDLLILERIKNN